MMMLLLRVDDAVGELMVVEISSSRGLTGDSVLKMVLFVLIPTYESAFSIITLMDLLQSSM